MDHDKKIVLVTGCAKGGIGYEYCKAFAAHDCRVVASDIAARLSDLEDLVNLNDAEAIEIDVASDQSVKLAISKILVQYGRIDVLVNNAGIGSTGPLAELSLDAIRRAWEVNTLGQLRMVIFMVNVLVCMIP